MVVLLVRREESAVILKDPLAKIALGPEMNAHIPNKFLQLDSRGILRMTPLHRPHALRPGCFRNARYHLYYHQKLNLRLLS